MIEPSLREHIASDGYRLKFRHWAPENPRGIVIALHGIQSHVEGEATDKHTRSDQ